MSTERNIWIEAVGKLIQLTQDRELVWAAQEPPLSFSQRPDFGVEVVFVCNHGERNLRLYEKYIRENVEECDEWRMRPITRYEWKKQAVLELIDANGNSLWVFPELIILNDLATAIQYRVAGVRDFLAELLAS